MNNNAFTSSEIEELQSSVELLLRDVPIDFGGGCSVRKATVCAYLITRFQLKSALDIGVYRGRSYLPMCDAMRRNGGGKAVAVDPWSRELAREFDNHALRGEIDRWADQLDFESVYQDVVGQLTKHGLEQYSELVRLPSALATQQFSNEGRLFDLIHIDGNHDTSTVMADVAACLKLVRPGGFIVLDDVSWDSVRPAFTELAEHCQPLLLCVTARPEDDYAIFATTPIDSRWTTALAELPLIAGAEAKFGADILQHFPRQQSHTVGEAPPSKPPGSNRKLLICDDFFPNLLTGFRVAEYNALLRHFPNAVVRSWAGRFRAIHAPYASIYPSLASRVAPCTEYSFAGADFVYTNFLNNAVQLIGLGTLRCPFAFVLYPGGGFGLDDPESDAKLRYVLESPLLRAIVVTTSITATYLRERMNRWGVTTHIEVVRIDGVTIAEESFAPTVGERGYWGEGRETLNICFAANKYLPRLEHKGYQEFVAAGIAVARKYPFVRLHIVGGADATDGDYQDVSDRVSFHGALETSALRTFFHDMDLIVSPSLVGKVHTGQFDGFPTATCVEASLCGVGMVVTNPLHLEEGYSRIGAIKIVEPTAESVTAGLMEVVDAAVLDTSSLRTFGQSGRTVSRERYSLDTQMFPRIEMLARHLNAMNRG